MEHGNSPYRGISVRDLNRSGANPLLSGLWTFNLRENPELTMHQCGIFQKIRVDVSKSPDTPSEEGGILTEKRLFYCPVRIAGFGKFNRWVPESSMRGVRFLIPRLQAVDRR